MLPYYCIFVTTVIQTHMGGSIVGWVRSLGHMIILNCSLNYFFLIFKFKYFIFSNFNIFHFQAFQQFQIPHG